MFRSCCFSSAGDLRKNYLPCSGSAFPAHGRFVGTLGTSFQSFPYSGCGRNKLHAFQMNEVVIRSSCVSVYLLSFLLSWQEPSTLCSTACAMGYNQGAKEGTSPSMIRTPCHFLLFCDSGVWRQLTTSG